MKSERNKKLAAILGEMAAIYKYKGSAERFRSIAYAKASRVIASLQEDIAGYAKSHSLTELPGISRGIADKISEYLETGKISKHQQLKRSVPPGITELMGIRGLGPTALKQLHAKLHISSRRDLVKAIAEKKITRLKGFGKKKLERIESGLQQAEIMEERTLLWDGLEDGETVMRYLEAMKEVKRAALAGNLRRRTETTGGLVVLVSADAKSRKRIVEHFTAPPFARKVVEKKKEEVVVLLKGSRRPVRLLFVDEEEWGAALIFHTGSEGHFSQLEKVAEKKGYALSDQGIFSRRTGKKAGGKSEEEIYKKLGLQFIPPEMREDRGEIEPAAKKGLPRLITSRDIRGDLQMHSDWSDGLYSMEEIANYILRNFSYSYIAFTDHSRSARVAGGMDEETILKQISAVEALNRKLGRDFVKKGLEVDILPDGKLDISDEILEQLDWVVASVHSNFNRDNTDRIIRACENPFVNCIGHPTGRKIGIRGPYEVSMEAVMEAAKFTGTALEINAQANRLDLNDENAMLAREMGVKLVISTDSHSLSHYHFMRLGVYVARRAWCTAADILNTGSWNEISKWVKRKRRSVEQAA